VWMRSTDEIHRDVRIDQDHGPEAAPYPLSI
jgi:hypothetical protein